MREPEEIRKVVRDKIKELIDETDMQWAYDRRKDYIQGLMEPLVYNSLMLLARYEIAVHGGNLVAMQLVRERMELEIKKLVKHVNELYFTKPANKSKQDNRDRLSPDMIERARHYPYDELLPMKRGMAVCPFHADKSPSFSVKNNYGHCFGCHWSGDPIKFVMEQEGIPFMDAVKRLQ